MRRNKLNGTNKVTLRRVAQFAFKAILFALIFSFVFAGVVYAALSIDGSHINIEVESNVADAAKTTASTTKKLNVDFSADKLTQAFDLDATSGAGEAGNDGFNNSCSGSSIVIDDGMHNGTDNEAIWFNYLIDGDLFTAIKSGVATLQITGSAYKTDNTDKGGLLVAAKSSKTDYSSSTAEQAVNDAVAGYTLTTTATTRTYTFNSSSFSSFNNQAYILILLAGTDYHWSTGQWGAIYYNNVKLTVTLKQYTITLNKGIATNSPTTSIKATGGVALPDIATLPTATGYDFKGFYLNSTGNTQIIDANGKSVNTNTTYFTSEGKWKYNGSLTLYAQFATHTGTITYHANGGTGSNRTQTFNYSDEKFDLLSTSIFTRSGYTLIGWATSASASDKNFSSEQNVSAQSGHFSVASTSTKFDLWAVWKESDFGALSGKSKTDGTWGNADNPFVIESSKHFINLANIVNGKAMPFDSVTDLSFSDVTTFAKDIKYSNCYFLVSGNISLSSTAFEPIGTSSTNCFSGIIYGGAGAYSAAKTARTVTVAINHSAGNAGLFGYISSARLEYITVSGSVTGAGNNVGGLAGYATNSTIDHCTNRATVMSRSSTTSYFDAVGGILGYVGGTTTVTNCTNTGKVDGKIQVGGIVGYSNAVTMTINGCNVTGNVTGHQGTSGEGAIGGIIGRSWSDTYIENCTVNATISGTANGVGGIFGHKTTDSYNLSIKGCRVDGSVTGGINVGGIAGRTGVSTASKAIVIENCYNTASVKQTNAGSTGTVGGIVGYLQVDAASTASKISNCVNKGSISCVDENVGGIAGNTDATDAAARITVEYCYNLGTVSTAPNVPATRGGVLGIVKGTVTVTGCWNFHQDSNNGIGSHLNSDLVGLNEVYPAKNTDDLTSTDWAFVVSGTRYTAFRIFGTAYQVENGHYLQIYSQASHRVVPSQITSADVDPEISATAVNISNAVFSSTLTDTSGVAVKTLAIDDVLIDVEITDDKIEIVYNGIPAKADDWILKDNNPYVVEIKVLYRVNNAWTDKVPSDAHNYDVKISLISGESGEDPKKFVVGNYSATYSVLQMNIENKQNGLFVMPFGYGGQGAVVANARFESINSRDFYQLERKTGGALFGADDSPWALVYRDSVNNYSKLANYVLSHIYTRANGSEACYDLTSDDVEFSLNGTAISGEDIPFAAGGAVQIVLTLKGKGNYTGTRNVRFTLMQSDFGGRFTSANWGSASNPFLIETDAHLLRLSQIVNGAEPWNSLYTQNPSVYSTITSRTYAGAYFEVSANVAAYTSRGFVSIGMSQDGKFFSGNFDGKGHTITLAISENAPNVGLFGFVSNATLTDINTAGSVASVFSGSASQSTIGTRGTGALVGYADTFTRFVGTFVNNATIRGINVTGGIGGHIDGVTSGAIFVNHGSVTATGTVAGACTGGVFAYITQPLSNAVNDGNITGKHGVGGVVGKSEAEISNCKNTGEVKSTASYSSAAGNNGGSELNGKLNGVGGIVGYTSRNINDCANDGTVSAPNAYGVGGIAGSGFYKDGKWVEFAINSSNPVAGDDSIPNTGNLSDVTGGGYVGGIIGFADGVTISENCIVESSVTGKQYVGGVAGMWVVHNASQMTRQRKVQSEITISGDSYVGGLVGWLDASDCRGLVLAPFISNGKAKTIKVQGASYVGALYGGFEGYGYKRNTDRLSDEDTRIYINDPSAPDSEDKLIYVEITLKSGGRVAGGLIGYASGVGILFLHDWIGKDHTPITFMGGASHTTSFFGGLVGVLGENATIESARQISDSNDDIGGVAHELRFRESSESTTIGGDFVGSIVGFIASTAGAYMSSDATRMGNTVQLFNNSILTAGSYVGGIFGAVGRVNYNGLTGANADPALNALLQYGKYDATASAAGGNILRYAPADGVGGGKLFNLQPITGTGDYVGGIVGYVGEGALLALVNKEVTTNTGVTLATPSTYLSVFNGNGDTISNSVTGNIRGRNYVGGIAGWLSSSSHEFSHIVSRMVIVARGTASSDAAANGSYAGGLFGYMAGGTISGSFATGGYTNQSPTTDAFRGSENIGGLVGMMDGGTITGSLTRGFLFDNNTTATKGGVAGRVSAGATISSSWAIYVATSPTYSTVSANSNGKYVIVDSRIVPAMLNFYEYGRMTGLFGPSVTISVGATSESINKTTRGKLSIRTSVPSGNNQLANKQLVFYDASGNDRSTGNSFEVLANQSGNLYYRLDMAASNNFSICVVDIEFKDVKPYEGSDDNSEAAHKNAADAYRAPASLDSSYSVTVTTTSYPNTYIKKIVANAYYKNGTKNVLVGTYDNDFSIGDAATPYIITNKTQWNTFAAAVRNGTSYSGATVKLATNLTNDTSTAADGKVLASELAGHLTTFANGFKGIFDGDGHTIKIDSTNSGASAQNLSLFPNASGATFKNLTITGTINAGNNTESYNVAAFVAVPRGRVTFENCTSDVAITAFRSAGGFIADTNKQTVKLVTCVNTGRISTSQGNNESYGEWEKADYANDGKYYTQYPYGTGGLVGIATANIVIESCKNSGVITGGNNVGGILGYGQTYVQVYNSANTGAVTSHLGLSSEPNRTEALSYVGGIVGKTGDKGYLRMYASYNSGKIVAYGSICGGLAGGVGEFYFPGKHPNAIGYISTGKNQIHQGDRSIIAYCYNNGEVHVGGSTSSGKESTWNILGRESPNGSIVGGIVGAIGYGLINYCYNQGKIVGHNIIGYTYQWQMRMGGIAGQAQPTAAGSSVSFNYCYNIGIIEVDITQSAFAGNPAYGTGICGYMDEGQDKKGDFDSQDATTAQLKGRLSGSNNYVLTDAVHYKNASTEVDSYYTSVMVPSGTSFGFSQTDLEDGRYIDGTPIASVADFTTYMGSDGNYYIGQSIGNATKNYNVSQYNQASSLISTSGQYLASFNATTQSVSYASSFLNGTGYGYVYIYGCLPQLAVFSMDTKEGLSMLAVSYGRNEKGEIVGSQAGSKESPYVIKDGVGLLAMSALTGATSGSSVTGGTTKGIYTFKDKYIEFASRYTYQDKDKKTVEVSNNIDNITARYINMDMSASTSAMKSSSTGTTSFSQNGKNYFLWANGGASGRGLAYGLNPISGSALRTSWVGKNRYYSGANNATLYNESGANFYNTVNFYPIGKGGSSSFMGNFDGAQGYQDAYNTEILNLKVSNRMATNSYAGLFGSIYNATVKNITVTGVIDGYMSGNSYAYKTFAGGIAGYAGGNSVIDGCQAGKTGSALTVTAYGNYKTLTAWYGMSFAGGIAGAAGPKSGPSVTETAVTTVTICNSSAVNATIKSAKSSAGGILGFAGDPRQSASTSYNWNSANVGGNFVAIDNVYVYGNTVVTAVSGVSSTGSGAFAGLAGTDIGGIVGTNDGVVNFTVSNANVGKNESGTASKVTVSGQNSVGGVIGTARGGISVSDVSVARQATVSRAADWGTAQNVSSGLYFTAIGGIMGRTLSGSSNTMSGNIEFAGTVDVQTVTGGTGAVTGNIGGVVGAMGEGTRFREGSIVTVTGTISVLSKTSLTTAENNVVNADNLRNVGGVVGATIDGIFDGYFDIKPTINASRAINVGGFIGRNFGVVNLISGTTEVTVGGRKYSGTVINVGGDIKGKSEVGGLVGCNGYTYSNGTVAGYLRIGADSVYGTPYLGTVTISIGTEGATADAQTKISASGNNVGGIVGTNTASGSNLGLLIRKGTIYNYGTVAGVNNVGGVIGNNTGDIEMGGSSITDAALVVVNSGSINGTDNIGGVVGYLQQGTIAGTFANTGSVNGTQFVGGSIGRMDKNATLVAGKSSNTYFYNGVESGATSDETASSRGSVKGVKYVGGSVGAIFGSIQGDGSYDVRFINVGTVDGSDFVGGNIGVLAGAVNHAGFTNSGEVSATGTNAIGGSVGIIGITSALSGDDYSHADISVSNAHFEFTGTHDVTATGVYGGTDSEESWGGVGGAIGVIGGAGNDFNNAGGAKWNNVTLYTASGVVAKNVVNVGGAIGLIKADNITINNMLAYYTNVNGQKNVGGHIGAVYGSGIEINDSFNIEGTVTGATAGGIIGLAQADTVADTSYWVKGYLNVELMALNIDTIITDLGKYSAVTKGNVIFTEELTNSYTSPSKFDENEKDEKKSWKQYLSEIVGKPVEVRNGVWSYEQNADTFTTGAANTGWYYVYANDRDGLDAMHSVRNDRDDELKYWKRIADAYTAEERENGDDDNAKNPLVSPLVAQVNGSTVTSGYAPQKQNIYASALASTVDGYYLYMDASGVKPNVWHGTQNNDAHFYIQADTHRGENVAVYYRAVAIGGRLTYNGYSRYVPITDDVSEGIMIEYTYEMPKEGDAPAGSYRYTMFDVKKDGMAYNGEIYQAGDYTMDVSIYFFDDLGKPARIGGIDDGELIIDKSRLGVTLQADPGLYNGANTTGSVKMTVNGISPLDNTEDRFVQFMLESDGEGVDRIYGTLNLSAIMNSKVTEFNFASRAESQKLVNLTSSKMYLSRIVVSQIDDVADKSCLSGIEESALKKTYNIEMTFSFTERIKGILTATLGTQGASPNYVADEQTVDFKVDPRELTVMITGSSSGRFNGGYHNTSFKFNGWADDEVATNYTTFIAQLMPYLVFDPAQGNEYTTEVWSLRSAYNTDYFIAEWLQNSSTVNVRNMRLEGSYQIGFSTKNLYEGKPATDNGNYYLTVTANPLEYFQVTANQFRLTWSSKNSGVYNAKYQEFVATLTADYPFENADLLEDEIATAFPDGFDKFGYTADSISAISDTKAQILFKVGPNVGTYKLDLPARRPEDTKPSTENCAIVEYPSGTYNITKLTVTIDISGTNNVIYNGGYHLAEKIVVETADKSAVPPQAITFSKTIGRYIITLYSQISTDNDEKDNQVTVDLTYNGGDAVNVGEYTATLGAVGGSGNFDVKTGGEGSINIQPAVITLAWSDQKEFTYNRQLHGRLITSALTTAGDEMTMGMISYPLAATNAAATFTITNANKTTETFRIPVAGTPAAINAGEYTATVSTAAITVSGTNKAGDAQRTNYTIVFANAMDGKYKINPRQINSVTIDGGTHTKVYDATRTVIKLGKPKFNTGSTSVSAPTSYDCTAIYDSSQAGSRTVTYTVTLKGTDAQNFIFSNKSVKLDIKLSGTITQRELVVSLDILRNGYATRMYNGNVWYGGVAGASSTAGTPRAVSAIHRSGEGFTVTNIAEDETANGAVIVTAAYSEVTTGRTRFDGYVNNVTGTGANLELGSAKRGENGYYYKKLIFTLRGSSASNYTFTVTNGNGNVGDKIGNSSSSGTVTVLDSIQVKIEITANILRATYFNTAQSYANADNSYNENWVDVTGSAAAVSGDALNIVFVNNWKYQNNNPITKIPARYTSYTVIRGAAGSNVLSARFDSVDGVHINYQLSNQPILTIGYFVDKEEFEIGSLASLMIATYYYGVSRGDFEEFGGIIISQAIWNRIATIEQYNSNRGYPTVDKDGQPFVDEDNNAITIRGWDDYFSYLASEAGGGYYIFLNENEEEVGWGYYAVDENSTPSSFDKFKQIANVSGVFTNQDIAILDGMFKKTIIGSDGNVIDELSYDWGVGGKYLTNFAKGREGEVATAFGGVFTGTFSGTYNGNGYTVDKLNIVGMSGGQGEDTYVGMFSRIADTDSAVANVQNVHLRNISISAMGAGNLYVGGIAGEMAQTEIENVSVHASITVNSTGSAYVGGLFGKSEAAVDGAIAVGSITGFGSAVIGGIIGQNDGNLANAVSLMYVWATADSTVGGLVGAGAAPSGVSEFMSGALWKGGTQVAGGASYTELYNGSVSGYGAQKYYYIGDTANSSGTYDVLNDVKLTALDGDENSMTSPHESMRLADIVDVYVLLYGKKESSVTVENKSVAVYDRNAESPLVGTKHGTDNAGDAIVIANQQGIALMRELRFATFALQNDVNMYSTYKLRTAQGAFYGKVLTNGYCIYIASWDGAQKMFEAEPTDNAPTAALKAE